MPDKGPQRAFTAAGWALASGMVHQFSQAAVSLTLAAILGPAAFGVIALATLYVLFVEFLVRQGIVQAVIQRAELDDEHLDAAFWMSFATAIALGVFTVVFAPTWAGLNDAPDLEPLLISLCGLGVLQSLWQVPTAVLQRALDFRRSEVPLNVATVLGGVVGVTAALLGAEEWSIVYQLYTYGVVGTILLYRATTWRPHLRYTWAATRDLFSMSSGAFMASLGNFLSLRADAIVLGLFFGPLALGLYRLGARFVQLIINMTSAPLGRVTLAVLSREQGDPPAFRAALRGQLLMLSLLVFPALGILLASGRGVVLLFGDEWDPATPVVRILALGGMARCAVLFTSPVLQSVGRPHLAAASQWFSASVHLAAILGTAFAVRDEAVETQIVAAAMAYLIAQLLVVSPSLLVLIARATALRVRDLLTPLAAPFVAGSAAAGVGLLVDLGAESADLAAVPTLVVVGSVSTVVAGVVLLATSAEARRIAGRLRSQVIGPRAAA